MKFDYQDKIDSYVQGEMTADERKAFEQEVQNNEELRDQLEYTNQVKSLITSRQEKMALLRQWETESQEEEKHPAMPAVSAQKSSKKKLYWISGIAAILIAGFFGVNSLFMNTGNSEGQQRDAGADSIFVPNDTISKTPVTNDSTSSFNVEP